LTSEISEIYEELSQAYGRSSQVRPKKDEKTIQNMPEKFMNGASVIVNLVEDEEPGWTARSTWN
jgi:hypothetical protein